MPAGGVALADYADGRSAINTGRPFEFFARYSIALRAYFVFFEIIAAPIKKEVKGAIP